MNPYAHAPFQATSATSKAAALAAERDRPTKAARIVAYVCSLGSYGATRDEIAAALTMLIQTVCSAVAAALADGRLRETLTERVTRSGRKARVLVAVVPEIEGQLTLLPTPDTRRYPAHDRHN